MKIKIKKAQRDKIRAITKNLNDLVGKSAFIEFCDGRTAAGFLHQTLTHYNGKTCLVQYYLETPLTRIYFQAVDVSSVEGC